MLQVTSPILEAEYTKDAQGVCQYSIRSQNYTINFETMEQINLGSKMVRQVCRVPLVLTADGGGNWFKKADDGQWKKYVKVIVWNEVRKNCFRKI